MANQPPKSNGPGTRVNAVAIRKARLAKGMSQKDLADALGWDANMVFRIEKRGTAAPESVKKLMGALEMSVDEILLPTSGPSGPSPGALPLPLPLPDFTGRGEELARIVARLRGGRGLVGVSAALRGMGGIGKTTIAVQAAWNVRDDFPDGQLLIELRGMSEHPLSPTQVMSLVVRAFHPDESNLPDSEAELLARYRQVLAGKKALVLLDDAKDEGQVRPLLAGPPTAFLVTSRDTLALDAVESIRLGALSPGEALSLLRSIVEKKGTEDELRRVAELCGHLPLALRVAGDFLRLHENWSLPKYLGALRDEATRLGRLKGRTPDRDVAAVLGLSASQLAREAPARAELWHLLSVFPADFDSRAAAAVWGLRAAGGLDPTAAEDELTALLDRSLIEYAADRYSLHDLMRPVARNVFNVDGSTPSAERSDRLFTAEHTFATYYCSLLAVAESVFMKGNDDTHLGLSYFDREEANIRHGQRWAAAHQASGRVVAELCRDYPLSGSHIIAVRLSAVDRVSWLEPALVAARAVGNRRSEGPVANLLGNAWFQLGDFDRASASYQQSLTLARETKDRIGECPALVNVGNVCLAVNDTEQAIRCYQEARQLAHESGRRRAEAGALVNLARAFRQRGGPIGDTCRAANECLQRAFAAFEELGDALGQATTMYQIAELSWWFAEQMGAAQREAWTEAIRNEAAQSADLQRQFRAAAIESAAFALAVFREIEHPHAELVRSTLSVWRGEKP